MMAHYDVRLRLRSYLEDGLLEMSIALALVTLCAWFLVEELVFLAWLLPWMFLTVIHPASKKRVAAPRGGVVQFPRAGGRGRMIARIVLGLALFVLIGLVAATASARDAAWFRPIEALIRTGAEHLPLTLGMTMTIVLAKLGMRGMTPRLVILALLSLLAGLLTDLLIPSTRMGALVAGAAIGVPLWFVGYVIYRRYLRTHPPLEERISA